MPNRPHSTLTHGLTMTTAKHYEPVSTLLNVSSSNSSLIHPMTAATSYARAFLILTTLLLTMLLLTLSILSVALPHTLLALPPPAPLPLILWHGLGDNYAADGIQDVLSLASEIHPGTFTYAIRLGDDAGSDRTASFLGNTTIQIQDVCDAITSHPVLSNAPAVDALGFSQGGLLLRGLIQRCGDRIKVRSLVTFGSPHSGISTFKNCAPTDWLCQAAFGLLRGNTWSGFVQDRLVPAQYYRTLNASTGEPTEEYLEHSNLLADVNNEREERNQTYKDHLSKIEKFVMYRFEDENAVIPPESTWFGDVWQQPPPDDDDEKEGKRIVTPLRERKLYEEDWLGLRNLDESGGLEFKKTPGKHMQIGEDVLREVFDQYFGPPREGGVGDEWMVWSEQRLRALGVWTPLAIQELNLRIQQKEGLDAEEFGLNGEEVEDMAVVDDLNWIATAVPDYEAESAMLMVITDLRVQQLPILDALDEENVRMWIDISRLQQATSRVTVDSLSKTGLDEFLMAEALSATETSNVEALTSERFKQHLERAAELAKAEFNEAMEGKSRQKTDLENAFMIQDL